MPKYFIPLESNPEVMTDLVHRLGLSKDLAFHDVFSIDDPELLAFVPRPAYALLLVFPVSDAYEKFRNDEDAQREVYKGSGAGEEVVWYKQTIRNACGLYGILHATSNGQAAQRIDPGSDLANLLQQVIPLKPVERALVVSESDVLESAHHAAAVEGNTAAPEAEAEVDLHYLAYVKSANGHLWELDGRRKGPLDRGQLDADDDVLSPKALDLGVRAFLKREQAAGGGDLRFSLIVLSPSME